MKRRQFLSRAGMAAATLPMVRAMGDFGPGGVRKGRIVGPNEKIRVAAVGCGGKGSTDIAGVGGESIVALCDVDYARAQKTFAKYPQAKRYRDFRQMLTDMDKEIDAVIVSTPDHMHFPPALMAIEMGKHVYVQKPLTHTVAEARALTLAARRHEVVTQMGNQGHANEGTRLVREWVQAGAIGTVREVHVWTNRPIWPQGGVRPPGAVTPPDTMDWNLWLGVAPDRAFVPDVYAPFKWRGWWDFGCGALGDMACHIMDASYWALDLKHPVAFEAEQGGMTDEMAPDWSIVRYEFPARGSMPPVKMTWFDGIRDGKPVLPPRPRDLEDGREMPKGGQIIIGDKGTLMDTTDYGAGPRLVPESRMKDFLQNERPEKTIPRAPNNCPYAEWVAAIRGQLPYGKPGSNFDYSGPLTETVLIGNLAIRTGRKIRWDAEKLECVGDPEATRLVSKLYRKY